MKKTQYDRETLLYVLYSYKIMIDRNKNYPAVLISDLEKSIDFVLQKNNYTETDYKKHREEKKKCTQ